ncbi:MAG: hypothetical protein BM556_04330 [Bacteriovorax sp. MedPE-SWde]|nr:MAG: hypothetical protein BM556_04330 [Bacteriovorax sp. MedPE-SWde]
MFTIKLSRGLILKLIIASFLTVFTFTSFAMEAGPKDIDKMGEALVKSGMIKKADLPALKKKMQGISPEQWKQINGMVKKMGNDPAMMKKLQGK